MLQRESFTQITNKLSNLLNCLLLDGYRVMGIALMINTVLSFTHAIYLFVSDIRLLPAKAFRKGRCTESNI